MPWEEFNLVFNRDIILYSNFVIKKFANFKNLRLSFSEKSALYFRNFWREIYEFSDWNTFKTCVSTREYALKYGSR